MGEGVGRMEKVGKGTGRIEMGVRIHERADPERSPNFTPPLPDSCAHFRRRGKGSEGASEKGGEHKQKHMMERTCE